MSRLRDVELELAQLLEAAGLGSLSGDVPTLYPGQYPVNAPDALLAVRLSGGEAPEYFLGGTGVAFHSETVTVLVRGSRAPGGDLEGGARARAAWELLFDAQLPGYARLVPEDARPTRLPDDPDGLPLWAFSFTVEYDSTP